MPVSFEQLVFEILGKDVSGSSALDKFRRNVDQTSRSLDDNTGKLDKNSKSIDNLGKSAGGATPLLGSLAGGGGMAALITAGVALSPVIATVGLGLGGIGLAAFGAVEPVLKASKAAGGLQANMAKLNPEQKKVAEGLLSLGKQYHTFEQTLQPQVLDIFGKGLQIAGHLMKDIEPIAAATGKAFNTLLGRVDAEFQSGQWQRFFGWMATNAGPDVQLLGNLIVDLTKTLPPLLQDLNPVAVGLLKLADAATVATNKYASFIQAEFHKGDQPGSFGKQLRDLGHDLLRTSGNADQLKASQQALDKRFADGKIAAGDLIHPLGTFQSGLQTAKTATDNEKVAVTQLTNALKGLGSGLLTTEADQVAWRQAQQAATQAIKANTGSLDSNRPAALAARAAIIASTQAALAFANQEVNVHHNTAAASDILRAQIRWLQDHAGHSKIATEEVQALQQALNKLAHTPSIHESIFMTGKGTWGIFGKNPVNSGLFNAPGAAGGMLVPGSGSGDTVPIWATPGEAVVPRHLVPTLAPFLRANRVPGFAAGGVIPSYGGGVGGLTSWTAHNWNASLFAISNSMAAAVQAAVRGVLQAVGGAPGGLGGPASASAAQAQAYARGRLGAYGWGFDQFQALVNLWNGESGWNRLARNPSSGAYGIPQALPASKMGAAANPPMSSAAAQINWGLGYIKGSYGSPDSAYGSWLSRSPHWYDQGGYLPVGLSLAYNGTGKPERVGGGNTYNIHIHQMAASRDTGRIVVEAIRKYEQGSGSGWRR